MPKMTEDQTYHIDNIVEDFASKATDKYQRGTIEHKGNIWDIPLPDLMTNLEEELIDAWVYLQTAKQRLEAQE